MNLNIPLKTLCVGHTFLTGARKSKANVFPRNILAHSDHFTFKIEADYERAQAAIAVDLDLDLVFIDADEPDTEQLRNFTNQVYRVRNDLPIILFGRQLTPRLFAIRAEQFIQKQSRQIARLPEEIQEHLFRPTDWKALFEQYARPDRKPRLEPGLDYADLESITPEERYIIKRMFRDSEVVQLFQLDTGLSGSRIYTVKPYREHMRILKIESAGGLRTVRDKFERLIQPRLDRHIGQLQGPIVEAEHLGGACYMLAGSRREASTLMKFLTSRNEVRREVIDTVLTQLALNLNQLYVGSENVELRFWAPMYSRVLPPELTLSDATILAPGAECNVPVIDQSRLDTMAAVPANPVLQAIRGREGAQPVIALKGFEIAEIDSQNGILYLQDDIAYRRPIAAAFQDKDHPVLRFKVELTEELKPQLVHPIFRKGRRLDVQGRVTSNQDVTLRRSINTALGEFQHRLGSKFIEVCSEHFIDPLIAARALLWDIGKENIIHPLPLLSPATHGDLNTGNILLEVEGNSQVWLIDFADARYGHIYFDLAKLEIEFRTHVVYDLFREIVAAGVWDEETALRFMLLLENVLHTHTTESFSLFLNALRAHHPMWYDQLYQRFLTYFEHVLYFLYSVRSIARSFGTPDQFRSHYSVAVFFQGLAAIKFANLDEPPFGPWSKRLALISAMVASNHAFKSITTSSVIDELVGGLKEQSAVAIIRSGRGAQRRYLLQWNHNWKMYNLVGGKMDIGRDSGLFAKTLQNELWEELGIRIGQDYRIVHEYATIYLTQFSRRDLVFKDYEFHTFEVELADDSLVEESSHVFVSPAEIESLRTITGEPISETVLNILSNIGQIEASRQPTDQTGLTFRLTPRRAFVSGGQAELRGELLSWSTSTVIDNAKVQLIESGDMTILGEPLAFVGRLMPGERRSVTFRVKPHRPSATVNARITFEHPSGSNTTSSFSEPIEFVEPQAIHYQPVTNPYVVGPPIEPAPNSPFFGRSQALNWVEKNLFEQARSPLLMIYGQRRTGKTSLLLQLEHRGRARSIQGRPACYAYVDLQKLDAGIDYFLLELAERAQKALLARGLAHIAPLSPADFRAAPYRAFDQFLDTAEKLLEGGALIFLLDEFELLSNNTADRALIRGLSGYLRSLVEHRASIAFVLAGTSPDRITPAPDCSPLLALSRSYELTYLDREQTIHLIRDPVKPLVQYDDAAVDAIWALTHGHPYFTQAICYHLITLLNERKRSTQIIPEDVEDAVERILREGNLHMNNLWDDLAPEEQITLSTLSDRSEVERSPATLREIQAWCQRCIDEDTTVRALSKLTERHLLEVATKRLLDGPPEPAYTPAMALMGRWAGRKHPLGALMRRLAAAAGLERLSAETHGTSR
ncbi:MAG TPA: ATP-binding protein [Anaerolineae bacterium]|nr:ATP-binding protein [Anaerolineae bacterium]